MEDQREKDKAIVYLAERGQTVEPNGQAYLVLAEGQRSAQGAEQPRFAPSSPSSAMRSTSRPSTRRAATSSTSRASASTTQLLFPDKNEPLYQ